MKKYNEKKEKYINYVNVKTPSKKKGYTLKKDGIYKYEDWNKSIFIIINNNKIEVKSFHSAYYFDGHRFNSRVNLINNVHPSSSIISKATKTNKINLIHYLYAAYNIKVKNIYYNISLI